MQTAPVADCVENPTAKKSPRWFFPGIYLLSILVLGLLARQIPGPLDADGAYYLLVARNLAQGHGLTIDAQWYFFHPFAGWPQPAGDLWMPLPSLLMAPAMLLGKSFRHAQIAQVLLAALLPLLAGRIALEEGATPPWAGLAALLTLFAGTPTVHWLDSDCYTAYALVGGAALYAIGQSWRDQRWLVIGGLLGGLAALTRNDGILLLAVLWGYTLLGSRRRGRALPYKPLLLGSALFLLPLLAWGVRNLLVFGHPTPVSMGFLLTMRDYGRLFAYQPQPDWTGFWQQGWASFFTLRRQGLVASLVIFVGAFQFWGLLPLAWIATGLRLQPERRTARRLALRPALWPAFFYLLILFLALIVSFPLLILHNTWFRSLNAFLPTGYACVALGLQEMVRALLRRRPALPARPLQNTFLILGASAAILIGSTALTMQLETASAHPQTWQQVGTWLKEHSESDEVIMAQDPMAVLLYGERRAVGIPHEPGPRLIEIARSYGVQKIVLVGESHRLLPDDLQNLYTDPTPPPPFSLLWQNEEIRIYGLDD